MKKVVSFSGGRTSAYLCKVMKDLYGDEVDFVFMDTGLEHPGTYDFVRECDKKFDLQLTCIKKFINPVLGKGGGYNISTSENTGYCTNLFREAVFKYGTPKAPRHIYCTSLFKKEIFEKYCKETYGKKGYTTYLGIRGDEPKRLRPRENVVYLADLDDSDKQDILDWWQEQDFNLKIPEQSGNCLFCIHKSPLKLALAARENPTEAEEFIKIVNLPEVRQSGEYHSSCMYRQHQSLQGIIDSFADFTEAELKARLHGAKKFETGSCTESCEVFQ